MTPSTPSSSSWSTRLGALLFTLTLALATSACDAYEQQRREVIASLFVMSLFGGALFFATLIAVSMRARLASIVFGAIAIVYGLSASYLTGCATMLSCVASAGGRHGSMAQTALAAGLAIGCFVVGIVALVMGIGMRARTTATSRAHSD